MGIDGRTLEPPRTGVGRYVHEICRELDALLPNDTEFYVYARRPVRLPVNSERWTMRDEPSGLFARLPAWVWLKLRAGVYATRDRLDVFWAASVLAPGRGWNGPSVTTVYDLCHLVAPETMPRGSRIAHALYFAPDLRRAAAVVALSHGTRARLRDHLGIPTEAVAQPAVAPLFRPPTEEEKSGVRARYGLTRRYFLSVATREPRKNLALLIAAYQRARAADQTGAVAAHDLILVGAAGWGDVRLAATPGVRSLGYVHDDDLPSLYGGATAFVFPSRYEGYGIPVLEARRCGAHVITTDMPETREAGGAAGVTYVRPELDALSQALTNAASTPARPSESTGTDQDTVTPPTWASTARVYADILTRAADTTSSPSGYTGAPTTARTARVLHGGPP